jgi:hypothetical protein
LHIIIITLIIHHHSIDQNRGFMIYDFRSRQDPPYYPVVLRIDALVKLFTPPQEKTGEVEICRENFNFITSS